MGPLLIALLVLLGGLLLVGLWLMGLYNGLVRLRQAVKNAFANIDVQLKRRHDLIPNLVNTVKGYASHEKDTLERVVNARARATGATTTTDKLKAEGELTQALGRLLMVAESYPELKANTNFLQLQGELTQTEDKIAYSRQGYNDAATSYNTAIHVFPAVLLAGMFGFTPEPLFETPAAEREAPKVSF
jgi:LemA protein